MDSGYCIQSQSLWRSEILSATLPLCWIRPWLESILNTTPMLCWSLIIIEDEILIYCKTLAGSKLYTRLRLVPQEFSNILFIAFYSNLAGRHLNLYRTLHHLCLWYYWPGMYTYVKKICAAWTGCAQANLTKAKSSKLVYNFPIEAPFLVLHADAYMVGKHSGFEGSETYLVALWNVHIWGLRASKGCKCHHFCFGNNENPTLIWLLPHHCPW